MMVIILIDLSQNISVFDTPGNHRHNSVQRGSVVCGGSSMVEVPVAEQSTPKRKFIPHALSYMSVAIC
jgi:hypothetical protein